MQQPLISKPHPDNSAQAALNQAAGGGAGVSQGLSLQDILVSISLSPGQAALNFPNWWNALMGNQAILSRSYTHLIVILLAILAIAVSNIPLSWGGKALQPLKLKPGQQAIASPNVSEAEAVIPLPLPRLLNSSTQDDVLVRAAVPHTIIPDRSRAEISTYVVQSGDTIFGIAAKFGLEPETLMWANQELEGNPDWLRIGQELIILPINGVYHQVGGSDTITGIAASYKVDPEAIINYPLNELDPDNPVIQAGQWLIVPGGQKPFVPRAVTAYSGPVPADAAVGGGAFGWPASGTIFQGFWSGHPGIDIAAWAGAPITAADSGHVIYAGWDDTGYGYTVVVDHGNGFQTLYAHLQAYYVEAGDNVAKGEQIAEMGSTGNSTGPHLHFEVRQGTVQRNPVGFLP
jgi:murein DD-endopeptidase MepM/ murein hydrolase activator NlpD